MIHDEPKFITKRLCPCGSTLSPAKKHPLCRLCQIKARHAKLEPVIRHCACGTQLQPGKRICDICRKANRILTNYYQNRRRRSPIIADPFLRETDLFDRVRSMGGPGAMLSSLNEDFYLRPPKVSSARLPASE